MQANNATKLALTIIAAAALTACGGGGGGSIRQGDSGGSDSTGGGSTGGGSTTTAWTNPSRVTLATDSTSQPASTVLVGVVDTGFLTSHHEIDSKVAGSMDFGGTGVMDDNVVQHGTNVAQIIAGEHVGYAGNAGLLLAKAADGSGTLYQSAITNGAQWALANGAQVLNLSIQSMWGTTLQSQLDLYNSAVSSDAVVVMSAGNDNLNVSDLTNGQPTIFSAGNEALKDVSLVVGAVNGSVKAPYSNVAGEDTNVQSRFLVAEGTNYVETRSSTTPATSTSGLTTFTGTSSAAPVVSAAAAEIRSLWPSMTAAQTAQLLLDTASKSFSSEYALNNCGSGGTTNCGFYYFGQGKLDLATAMQPYGVTSIPTGVRVNDDASYSVASTTLTLPMAFGDALNGKSVNAALFDSYGRNYNFNLLSRVTASQPTGLAQLMDNGMTDNEVVSGAPGMVSKLGFNKSGQMTSSTMKFQSGTTTLSFNESKGSVLTEQETAVPMLGLSGNSVLSSYDRTRGMGAEFALSGDSTAYARLVKAGTIAGTGNLDKSASRQEVGVNFAASKDTTITAGVALTQENNAMLGTSGGGAMSLDGSSATAATLRLNTNLNKGWSAFGYTEVGTMSVQGNGVLNNLSGVRTSQFGAGLQWADDEGKHGFGLAVSQPIRVESATAEFNTPVGRTLDGKVVYQSNSVSLQPSGRQLNLDVAYQTRLTHLSSLRFNALYIRDNGHVNGNNDAAVAVAYRLSW